MAVLAPPVQVVASGAPPFVQVPSGAPPFVVTTGPAPPIQIVTSGAPPITLFNEDGSIWSAGGAAVGGAGLLVGEANGFATDFTYATDASRVAVKAANVTTNYAVDAFYTQAGTSPKMVYDVAGTLGWSPHNLLLQSQTFEAAFWSTAANLTKTANVTTAPDGTLTADSLVVDTSTSTFRIEGAAGSLTIGTAYTFSVYAKPKGYNFVSLQLWDSSYHGYIFNISTGVMTATVGTPTSYTITALPNGWYRLSVTRTTNAATLYTDVMLSNDGTNTLFTGDGVSGVYVWGAQLNLGTVPTAYLPTTTAARVGLALDYDPVTHAAKGLLCEPQATNLAVQSADFSTTWSAQGSTVSVNATAAPDGTTTADKLVETAATSEHKVYYSLAPPNVACTWSVYAKAAERTWFYINSYVTGDNLVFFNLGNGTLGTVPGGTTATITAVGNGWYRCTATKTVSGSFALIQFGTATGDTANSFAGDITKGIYLWGAQMEAGTVATSPIPTLAATVTRAADQVNVTPASINYSATAGSWWVDAEFKSFGGNDFVVANIPSGNAALFINSTTQFGLYDGVAFILKTVPSILGSHKLAAAFASADRAVTADGLVPGTDTQAGAALLSPGTSIQFGGQSTVNTPNGYIRKVRYLPRRKSGAEMVTETTP